MDTKKQEKEQRREKGTGTVYQVESTGKWRARITIDGKTITRVAKSEQEARKILRTMIKNQKELASLQKYNTKSVEEYMKNWVDLYKKNALAPSSYRSLKNDMNYYVFPYIGSVQLQNLSTDHIQKMIAELVRTGKSLAVIKRARSAIDNCLKKAVQLRDIPYNPCSALEMPSSKKNDQLKKKPICVLDRNEVSDYISIATEKWSNGIQRYRIGWAFVLVLATGIRRGELAALKWKDVDIPGKVMHVNQSAAIVLNEEKGAKTKSIQIIQSTTKSYSGERNIPLNTTAITALENLRRETEGYVYVAGGSKKGPVNVATLTGTHARIIERAGIVRTSGEHKGMHCLRHSFCSHLIESEMDIKTISELMGHADVGITLDVYGHIFSRRKRIAVEATDFIKLIEEERVLKNS